MRHFFTFIFFVNVYGISVIASAEARRTMQRRGMAWWLIPFPFLLNGVVAMLWFLASR